MRTTKEETHDYGCIHQRSSTVDRLEMNGFNEIFVAKGVELSIHL